LNFDFRLPDTVTVSININFKADLQLRGFTLIWRCCDPCNYSNLSWASWRGPNRQEVLLHLKAIWSHSSVRPSFR